MKGLLIKDFKQLMGQKKILFVYLLVTLALSFSTDTTFISSYVPMLGLMLMISCISYDGAGNTMTFIMSLPVSASTYAVAKYVLTVVGMAIFSAAGIIIQFASIALKGDPIHVMEILSEAALMLFVFFIIASLMIPVYLKFSPEKGKIVMFIVFGVIMVIVLAGKTILLWLAARQIIDVETALSMMGEAPTAVAEAAIMAVAVIALAVSMVVSIRIMQKKEF